MLRAVLFDWGDTSTGKPMVPPWAPSFSPPVGHTLLCLRRAKPASGVETPLRSRQR
jgi:hypothetical protein